MTLDVSVTDAGGKGVAGLTEADFAVTEDGNPQAFDVARDTVPDGIRVLLIYDTSGSITKSWGSAAKRAAFEAQLAKLLADANSRGPFLLQVIGLSDTATKSAWAAPDADQNQDAPRRYRLAVGCVVGARRDRDEGGRFCRARRQ